MRNRVLLIGLEGAEPTLLEPWMDDGTLPVLAALRDRGAWGRASAVHGFGDGTTWPSLITARNPAGHGRLFLWQLAPGRYGATRFDDDADYAARPLWDWCSDAGLRCAVVDVPRSPLSPRIHGMQICDWLAHDPPKHARSTPPDRIRDAIATWGTSPVPVAPERRCATIADVTATRDALLQRIETRTRFTEALWAEERWDLFVAVYAGAHDVSHRCWHVSDPTHPWHDPAVRAAVGDPTRDVYVAQDAALGRLLRLADRDTTVVVFAGQGMEPDYTANRELDLVVRRLDEGADVPPSILDRARQWYRRRLPARLQQGLRPLSLRSDEAMLARDRRRRRAFAVPHNDNSGAIRVNLAGREPHGIVPPESYEALLDELEAGLRAIVDPTHGGTVVADVTRVRQVVRGPKADAMPDLLVVWRRTHPLRVLSSPRIGRIVVGDQGARSGDHSPRSLWVVAGPDVAPGLVPGSHPVEDLGATLARLLAVHVPDADGVPIAALFPGAG